MQVYLFIYFLYNRNKFNVIKRSVNISDVISSVFAEWLNNKLLSRIIA